MKTVKVDVEVIKDALWLIRKLSGSLGIDLSELEEHYKDSYNRLEESLNE
ncbi:hypothetical protein [Bacillus sp. JJ1474]